MSDFHVADTQYHNDCMYTFRSHQNIQATLNTDRTTFVDEAFYLVLVDLHEDLAHVWNSVEVHDLYKYITYWDLSRLVVIQCYL